MLSEQELFEIVKKLTFEVGGAIISSKERRKKEPMYHIFEMWKYGYDGQHKKPFFWVNGNKYELDKYPTIKTFLILKGFLL